MRETMLRAISVAAAVALAASIPVHSARAGRTLPDRYAPGSLDGTPVVVEHPFDGSTWSVWSYRNGAEYDIALSIRDADGAWSEPTFFGLDDDLDQVDPALAFDPTGTAYLAFAVRQTGTVQFALRVGGTRTWVGPAVASPADVRSSNPAVRIVGDRVVLAFRAGDSVAIADYAIAPGLRVTTHGIQEGPDVIDPLGRQADRGDGSEGTPGGGTGWEGPRSRDANDPAIRSLRSRVPDDRRN